MLLHHAFVKTAKKLGKELALVDRTTDRRLTWSRMLIASLILKNKFRKFDKGFIGVMLPTSAGCALTILGALMSGRTPVMINYSTGADKNAKYAQNKCNFSTIITSKALCEKIECPKIDGMVFIEDIMETVSGLDKIKAAMKSKLPESMLLSSIAGGKMDDTSIILFTSGSEKDPKAVQLTHRNLYSNATSVEEAIGLVDNDIILANLPYFHVFGLTICLWVPIIRGLRFVTYANPLDLRGVCQTVKEEKPTIMVGAPSFFWGYLRKSEPGDFASVRLAVSGADKCPQPLRDGFMKKHNMELYEGYGATETSPVVTVNLPGKNKPGSIGTTISGVKVRIENFETGKECSVGEVGKILVKGDLIMKGYFDDLEETSLHIRDGWYDTGDMGYVDEDNYYWHSGRLKRFVKIGGEMVSLVNVEDELQKFLSDDSECCVVEVPDSTKGARIVAAITGEVDQKKAIKELGKVLPNIALPKTFVTFEELPKMGSGKIDFRTMTDMVREQLNKES